MTAIAGPPGANRGGARKGERAGRSLAADPGARAEGPPAPRRGWIGLLVRTLAWATLFLVARTGPSGAAVLEGAVLADVLTWLVFRVLRWQLLGLRLDAEAAVEFAVVVLFLNRGWLLSIEDSAQAFAVSALAFLFVVLLKTVVWGVDHALALAGAREPASP